MRARPAGDAIAPLIDLIYEAALDESRWPEVLERLSAATDSQGASFWVLDSRSELKLPTFSAIGFDPGFVQEYVDVMTPYDPVNQYLAGHPDQMIVRDAAILTESQKDRHLFYDWQAPHSETRHRVVGTISPTPFVQSGVALHRFRTVGDFETRQVEQFTRLFRHVGRALEIGFRLGTFGNLQQATLDLLDRNPLAIVLLDARGRPFFANRAACRIGEGRDGVILSRDALRLARASDDRRLQGFIATAVDPAGAAPSAPGGAMLAARPSGRRPFSILVSPLAPGALMVAAIRPAACVVIADPERSELPAGERLKALYGLTPAEARLVQRLAAGDDLARAAEAIGIGYPTARARLAAIFRKTETRRQGELIRLLMRAIPSGAP